MDIETLNGKKIDCADASVVSLRDMYMRICACRDFEISHVWQRAIFLTAFLLGCFTAYGSVCSLFMDESNTFVYSGYVNSAAFGVSLVGVVVSLFWIMMAKGSKAWYELYESAIGAFAVKYPAGCDTNAVELSQYKWRKLIIDAHGIDDKIKEEARSRCIFSPIGGAYSVSKINIGIGILAFIVWVVLSFVHFAVAVGHSTLLHKYRLLETLYEYRKLLIDPTIMLIALLVVVFILPVVFIWIFKSGHLCKTPREILEGK